MEGSCGFDLHPEPRRAVQPFFCGDLSGASRMLLSQQQFPSETLRFRVFIADSAEHAPSPRFSGKCSRAARERKNRNADRDGEEYRTAGNEREVESCARMPTP
jgi:hypothetical protein